MAGSEVLAQSPISVDAVQESNGKRANELDGKTWTRYSISVWSDIKKTPEELALKHPAMFPAALAKRLIEMFCKPGSTTVLDPFAGVGSTLMAARELGKRGIGTELSPVFADIARSRLSQGTLFQANDNWELHVADARDVEKFVEPNSIDMVITSPPYWNVLMEKRTADYKERRDYGAEVADLGKIDDYREFLQALGRVFQPVYNVMRPGAYCCVVVMDLRKKDKFYPFHSDLALVMQDIGFIYDDLIIWDRRHEYNNFRPLGYPAVFRVNKAHEFVLQFMKPKAARAV